MTVPCRLPVRSICRDDCTGGIYAAPTDDPDFYCHAGKPSPFGGRWRGTRRMRGKCPEVAPSSVGCADSFPQRGKPYMRFTRKFHVIVRSRAGLAPPLLLQKSVPPAERREVHPLHLYINFHQKPCFSISLRPISTPITDAIIRPRVQPEESPRQCRPAMFVSRSVSILTLLE